MKNGIPILYVFFYEKLVSMYGKIKVSLRSDEIISCVRRYHSHQLPTKYNYLIVKDLVSYKLLRKISANKYEIVMDNYNNIVKSMEEYWAW